MKYYLAVDIGASSGRHIVGYEEDGELILDEVYRFANGIDRENGSLVWDTSRLFEEVKRGISKAFAKYDKIESLSVDTWGVDYVLMNGDEQILPVYSYRDLRTDSSSDAVHAIIPHSELYKRTGTQFNKFNTVYQLYSDKTAGRLKEASDFLYIPEYLMYKLTGVKAHEFTEASTSGLVNKETLEYDEYIFEKLGLPKKLASPIRRPGEYLGELIPSVAEDVGGNTKVILCATHDTASAVEAIDMDMNAPYISSGTWSLLGVKTKRAITDEKSRLSGYSNEGGVGYIRYQKNITGMWLVNSIKRDLCPEMSFKDIDNIVESSDYEGTFDVNDEELVSPENMATAISDKLAALGFCRPREPKDYFNAAYRSMALGYKQAINDLEFNTGSTYSKIFIVGGGARCRYLNRLTEEATGKRVVALPIEATAIGNLKMQIKSDKNNNGEK